MQTPNHSEQSPETSKPVKAILDTFTQLAPKLKATLVSEDPAIVTLDYEPVPVGFEKAENEAERKYTLVLDIIRDNLDLLGREPSHGHHFHESHEGVHYHTDGHHGHEEAATPMPKDPRDLLSETVTRATGRFFEMSAELARLALRNVTQSIVKTSEPIKTTLVTPLSPAWKERHLTKAGATDVRDCRELTNENGETVYLMPASEYREKVASKGLHLKDKKIREATRDWVEDIHRISPEDTTEEDVDEMMAALALRGETMYLVPILSGLKPAGFESCGLGISRASLPMLERLSKEIHDRIQVIKMTEDYNEHGFSRDQLLIYNPSTVDSVLKQYPEVFSALGIAQGTHSYNVIEQVLVRYNLANDEMTPEYSKAVGLLLGYDEYSIDNYDKPKKDRPEGKWEPHSYHFNEKPLCIWGVDYSIADPETNKDYQAQLRAYEGLQKWIEHRLEAGEKPYEVLKGIPVYKEHAETSAKVADTLAVQPAVEEPLPDTMILDKELSDEELAKVKKQWSLFQKLRTLKVPNPLQIRIQAGLTPLVSGTLVHGTSYSRQKIQALQTNGVLSGELIGIPEDSETHFCADFYKVPHDTSVKGYVDWCHVPDEKRRPDGSLIMRSSKMERTFLPNKNSRTNDQIAILIDPNIAELKELLHMDPYGAEGREEMKGIINQLPYDPNSPEGQRLSSILCGIPGNFISGIILPPKLAEDKDEIAFIRSVFEGVTLFNTEGVLIE